MNKGHNMQDKEEGKGGKGEANGKRGERASVPCAAKFVDYPAGQAIFVVQNHPQNTSQCRHTQEMPTNLGYQFKH